MATSSLQQEDYRFIKDLLFRQIGHDLGEDKEYLVENRLAPVAEELGMEDAHELIRKYRSSGDPAIREAIREAICEAMTTNETTFFRDEKPFDFLQRAALPALCRQRSAAGKLRIWSAGCSTGQEPFSIAMTIHEHFPELEAWSIELLATDISEKILDRARQGEFSQFEVQRGLPVQKLVKYFQQSGDRWTLCKEIRGMVTFKKFNLMDSFKNLGGPFDIVFLRNVLIYFNKATKVSILGKLRQVVAPDGYLMLGGAESVIGLTSAFQRAEGDFNFLVPVKR